MSTSPVKLTIRRVGNSQGVLLPKEVINRWGLSVGDYLLLDDESIRPPPKKNAHELLDELKRAISVEVLARFSLQDIRAKAQLNLERWRAAGTWGGAYDEWQAVLRGNDENLVKTMLGHDDRSNRLRQSMPYVGLLPQEVVGALREKN